MTPFTVGQRVRVKPTTRHGDPRIKQVRDDRVAGVVTHIHTDERVWTVEVMWDHIIEVFHADELEPAPDAQNTLTQALEAIASESEPRMSSYLSMQDMMLDYVEKVARMKKLADDALQAASQPTDDAAAGSEE